MQDSDTYKKSKRKTIIAVVIVLFLFFLGLFLLRFFSPGEGSVLSRTFHQAGVTLRHWASSIGLMEPLALEDDELSDPEGEEGKSATSLPPLSPPTLDGATIRDATSPRDFPSRGTFIFNSHLRANGNIEVLGNAEFINLNVLNATTLRELSVSGLAEIAGMINAIGGIRTGGANIDLEGGQLLGIDFLSGITAGDNITLSGPADNPIISTSGLIKGLTAGENVVISGSPENPTISVPEGGERVRSLNGQSGALNLTAGTDIAINGLTFANTSTLASVRSRGGCVSCLLDSDIADNLTIIGGQIDDTVIGGVTPAAAYFTNVAIGPVAGGGTDPALTVDGRAVFTGRVSGQSATSNDEFVTLDQVAHLLAGGGHTGVAYLNTMVGAITLAGTGGQINVNSDTVANSITLSLPQNIGPTDSPTFAGLTLAGDLLSSGTITAALINSLGDITAGGTVTAATFVSSDGTVRQSGESVLRTMISVFSYALPADTGSTAFTRISKDFTASNNPMNDIPPATPNMTREYRLAIKYADSVPSSGSVSWRIYSPSTSTVVDSFTTSGQNLVDLDEPDVFITGPLTIPTGDWRLEVSVPSGRVRVADIHIMAFDIVN